MLEITQALELMVATIPTPVLVRSFPLLCKGGRVSNDSHQLKCRDEDMKKGKYGAMFVMGSIAQIKS